MKTWSAIGQVEGASHGLPTRPRTQEVQADAHCAPRRLGEPFRLTVLGQEPPAGI